MQTYRITDYGVRENCTALQTQAIQHVFDLCKGQGGTVVVPKGRFYLAAVRMWSDTTLLLESGAELYGSDNCDDYAVFDVPEEMPMRSDMELITQYYQTPWDTYRRAIITAYGERNIAIIGQPNAVIDGQNCYDPHGEEHYRGPHAIFFSCCEKIRLEGYTVRHSGNFLHEANNCRDLTMRRVTCLGGSDGIHLHCTERALIEDCLFKTGDDCIAGININTMTVRRCILNTSCNLFRMGGVSIRVEDCYAYGPGYYPHRMTVVKGKHEELPRWEGRHDTLCLLDYFASTNFPYAPSDIHFKNCVFDNIRNVLSYNADRPPLQAGTHLTDLRLENVTFTDLKAPSGPRANAEEPLTVRMKNVTATFVDEAQVKQLFLEREQAYTTFLTE